MDRWHRMCSARDRFVATHVAADERGATPVEWVMFAALAFAAVVLVMTFGGGWFGDVA
jgi:hypothetical protein